MKRLIRYLNRTGMILTLVVLLMSMLVACGSRFKKAPSQTLPSSTETAAQSLVSNEKIDSVEEPERAHQAEETQTPDIPQIDEDGSYTTKEDVALYIHTYNKLPPNFITKKQAEKLGWQGGGLDDYMDGGCIGGTYFGNYEGMLPEKKGREYHECDIDTMHSHKRGAKRIVYSNDGLIYYTEDHYETFELLYGEE